MPIYVYKARKTEDACPSCREPFEVLQRMKDRPLARCPECRAAVEKCVVAPNAAFPKGPAELRSMGMARLEKRSDGTYENVSAQPGAQRHGSLQSLTESLKKGPKKILSD